MDLPELKRLVETANWFSNLGHAEPRAGIIPVTDVKQWKAFSTALSSAEFGLAHDEKALEAFPFGDMDSLPTTSGQEDPVHGNRLASLARQQDREAEFRTARLEFFKLAQQSLRPVRDHPLLKVGPTNFNPAARGAALFACRMAASEIVVQEPGLWCSLVRLYHQGNWPMGTTSTGTLVVL